MKPENKYGMCAWGGHLIQMFGESLRFPVVDNWKPLQSNKHGHIVTKPTFGRFA